MLDLESIKADLVAEQEGQYIEIPEWEGVKLGVRSLHIPAYKLALDQTLERHKRIYKGKPAPSDVRESDVGKILAKHILFGWEGIKQPYSMEYAIEVMGNPAGRELANQVYWAAAQVAEIEAKFITDAVKN